MAGTVLAVLLAAGFEAVAQEADPFVRRAVARFAKEKRTAELRPAFLYAVTSAMEKMSARSLWADDRVRSLLLAQETSDAPATPPPTLVGRGVPPLCPRWRTRRGRCGSPNPTTNPPTTSSPVGSTVPEPASSGLPHAPPGGAARY
jgi:hypothetical protein